MYNQKSGNLPLSSWLILCGFHGWHEWSWLHWIVAPHEPPGMIKSNATVFMVSNLLSVNYLWLLLQLNALFPMRNISKSRMGRLTFISFDFCHFVSCFSNNLDRCLQAHLIRSWRRQYLISLILNWMPSSLQLESHYRCNLGVRLVRFDHRAISME